MFENVLLDFCYKSGIKSILRDFKNTTFYANCFLYLVDMMLLPMYFFVQTPYAIINSKKDLRRPFILMLP